MKEKNLIEDYRRADHFSFLYYLHEEKDFRVEALEDLCHQILRHLVYHFDPNDLSRIRNLPTNYWEELEAFEQAVSRIYDRYE